MKKISEFTRQMDDLNSIAGYGRRTEAEAASPEFEKNVARVRDLWNRFGVPALRELQAAIDQFAPDFESAARIDFDGLRRAGCPEWRVSEMQTYVYQARNFMSLALQQLSQIPQKIDSLQPQDEEPWIHGNKGSDRIEFEMRGVLGAASDIRQRHERMRTQIARLSEWLKPSMLRPETPARGTDAN
jgi:hypothetical protein